MGKLLKKRLQKLSGIVHEDLEKTKKKIFVLVGPPSVGKSTWIKNTFEEEPYVISRDDIVDNVANSFGWTYDDMFITPPLKAKKGEKDEKYGIVVDAPKWMSWTPTAFSKVLAANAEVQKQFRQRINNAVSSGKDIVVDMTNMTPGSRRQALKTVKNANYEKIAVVFEFQGAEDLIQKIAQKRAQTAKRMGKSKTIPSEVFEKMFGSFVYPTKAEGFDKIVSVDNRKLLQKLANEPTEETNNKKDTIKLENLLSYLFTKNI